MMSATVVAVMAPAKVNLFLHITGRRDDGYHLLDSAFVFARFGDRLQYRADTNALSLTCSGAFASTLTAENVDTNLVLRAAHALANAAGLQPHGRIELEKHIPVAAGLGGGSADAAAAIRLLESAWNIRLPTDRRASLALELGADVPACLSAAPVRVRGIGEALSPLGQQPDWGLLLVNPGIAVPTGPVFRAFREKGGAFHAPLPDVIPWHDADWLAHNTVNDLEPPAIAIAPTIGKVLDTLATLDNCRLARMSGSGATCFALFDTPDAACEAERTLASRAAATDWWHWAGALYG